MKKTTKATPKASANKNTPKATPVIAKPIEYALVMRTCKADMTSYGGFKWPESGIVTAPDWDSKGACGNGLHGLLWGEGDPSLLDWSSDAKWLVCRVEAATIVDIGEKVKFPSCEVVYCGDAITAGKYVVDNGGFGRRVDSGTATAGDSGTATAGDSGTATAGDSGTATAGDSGTATAGDRGTATAGYRGTATAGVRGTATAGYSGVIAIQCWNGKRYKMKIATMKDEDGEGDLKPNVKYRLNDNGDFVEVEP